MCSAQHAKHYLQAQTAYFYYTHAEMSMAGQIGSKVSKFNWVLQVAKERLMIMTILKHHRRNAGWDHNM